MKLGIIDGVDVRVKLGVLDPVGESGVFDVVCMRPGEANGVEFSAGVLKDAVNLFENANVFVDHGGVFEFTRSVRDLAGVITQAKYQETKGITARLRLMTPSGWLEGFLRQLVADRDKGLAVPRVGLSADLYIRRKGGNVEEIRRVNSVDIVFDPAAGGSFERVLNSVQGHGGDTEMDEQVRDSGSVEESVTVPVVPPVAIDPGNGDEALVLAAMQSPLSELQELRRLQCGAVLESVLAANSDLPAAMAGLILQRFQGSIFDAADLQSEIAAVRQAWADIQESNVIQGMGTDSDGSRSGDRRQHQGIMGMWDSMDRVQMAFDKLMGIEIPSEHSDIPRLTGIRELYLMLTGDHEMYGRFNPDRVTLANVTTSTMTSVVKNALNKVLLKAYNMRPQWWAPIAYEEDFNTLNSVTWITLGGIADLDTVTEGNAYTEKSWSDNEETSDFVKKGNYVGITLEMIDRDNVGSIRQLPQKMGLAAARTLSGTISALFTDNTGTGPDLSDTYKLFDASNHDNLLTTALSTTAWDAVIQAMFKQAEATSTKRIGVRPATILVPIELEKTALTIINSPNEPGTADNDLNVRQGSARVIAVPEWTDTNNWAACASPLDLPGVCVGYRFGRAPEMFVADSDVVGSMFTNDEMRIKVRFFYAVGIGDYRALHKNNVA